jgi:hypothetical protein
VLRPHCWQATTVLAVWPPGRMLEAPNSTLEPREGKRVRGITVSVAFNPTPTRSTFDVFVIFSL